MNWLLVFLGGGFGALARFELGGFVQARAGPSFPWGTFAVNALGCLVIGLAATWIDERIGGHQGLRTFLLAGVLGGFTTFSSFGLETWRLVEAERLLAAGANAVGSLLVCSLAVAVGVALGRSG